MPDLTPFSAIVMVAYRLNDGTRVDAKSPSADRKLSWKAAMLS